MTAPTTAPLLSGCRRFFGPVVMVPKDQSIGWTGPVLLLDAEKLWAGRSLEFGSVANVHAEHPELWAAGTREVERGVVGVLLITWGQP